ncbi:esiB [Symbiodinium sp. CCMP2456]|nr:esiB [Symbiodinium sp. CCMP2456]
MAPGGHLPAALLASRNCTLWMAPSSLPSAGRGIFTGIDLPAGAAVAASRVAILPSRIAELTQLATYVFAGPASEKRGEAMSRLMVGPASLANHGVGDQVNCDLQVKEAAARQDNVWQQEGSTAELRTRRHIEAGEELFISYGTEEWFSDRGLQASEEVRTGSADEGGTCVSHVTADLNSPGLVASRRLPAKERLLSPAFLLPAAFAEALEGSPGARDLLAGEVSVLPVAFPGRFTAESSTRPANAELQIRVDGRPLTQEPVEAQALADSSRLRLEILVTTSTAIEEGEPIVTKLCDSGCPELFPVAWGIDLDAARRHAADAGDVEAQFQLAQLARLSPEASKESPGEALLWYRKAAESGHIPAQLRLGALLHDGDRHRAPDPAAAVALYHTAALAGSASAQFLLGLAYSNGDGVEADFSQAAHWFSLAARQGSQSFAKADKAMYNLAAAYRDGRGVPRDAEQAVVWTRRAAELGHTKAMFNLAVALSRGDGSLKNVSEAIRWYTLAAERGHVLAQYNLAYAYHVGTDLAPSDVESAKWFRRAAEGGSKEGQFMMSKLCRRGQGVAWSEEESVSWLRQAAGQNHGQAQYELAVALETGRGVPQNQTEADFWYRKAADAGVQRTSRGFFGLLGRLFGRTEL